MPKSHLTHWLLAAFFLFSVSLNVVHGYEHDENQEESEECEICIILCKVSDPIISGADTFASPLAAEVNYFFSIKNNPTTVARLTNSRAPPHISKLI